MDKHMTGSMLYNLAGTPRWKYVFWSPQAYYITQMKTLDQDHQINYNTRDHTALHPGRPSAYICTIVWLLEHLIRIVPTSYI